MAYPYVYTRTQLEVKTVTTSTVSLIAYFHIGATFASSKASCFWKGNESLSDCVQADIRRAVKAAFEAIDMKLAIEEGSWRNVKKKLLEGFPIKDFPGFHRGSWIFCCTLSLAAAQDTHHLYNAWKSFLHRQINDCNCWQETTDISLHVSWPGLRTGYPHKIAACMVVAYHRGYRMSELEWESAAGRHAIGILWHIELRCSQIKEQRLALMTCFAYAQSKAANGCGSSSSGVNAAMVAMSKIPPDVIRIIVEHICMDKNWHPSLPSVQAQIQTMHFNKWKDLLG